MDGTLFEEWLRELNRKFERHGHMFSLNVFQFFFEDFTSFIETVPLSKTYIYIERERERER